MIAKRASEKSRKDRFHEIAIAPQAKLKHL